MNAPGAGTDDAAGPEQAGLPNRQVHRRASVLTGRRRRLVRRGTQAIAAALSLVVLLVSGYAWATFRNFAANVTTIDAIAPRSSSTHPKQDIDGADQNILLVGDDHRPANASPQLLQELSTQQDGGGVNTDTMIVLHVPADGSKATMISFPRDSWVNIPGFGMNKLNAAFQLGSQNGGDTGGARLLIQVIENMTGLTIDHFVRVSMVGFYEIAQVLGPINVCLKQPAEDPYSGTNLPAGVTSLNAQQALSFVRQRHNLPGGDLDREIRQQYFLSAEFRNIVSAGTLLNPFKLQALLNAVSSNLETDHLDLLKLAEQMQGLQAGNLKAATIPITGTPTIYPNGVATSIVAVDEAAMPAFIAAVIGQPSAYQKAGVVSPQSVTVTVLNGSGTDGVATSNTALLDGLGFHTGAPAANGSTIPTTTIEYPAGMESQAKTLAQHVPGAVVAMSSSVHGVTLILGSDGRGVAKPTAAAQSSAAGSSAAPSASTGVAGSTAPSAAASSSAPARSYSSTDCIN